jgi:hypothetical protein
MSPRYEGKPKELAQWKAEVAAAVFVTGYEQRHKHTQAGIAFDKFMIAAMRDYEAGKKLTVAQKFAVAVSQNDHGIVYPDATAQMLQNTIVTLGVGSLAKLGGNALRLLLKSVAAEETASLRSLASQVRVAGQHLAARNQRTIAVGVDSKGNLFAGSSSGFDKGQRAVLNELGITRVAGSGKLHAEEELMREVPDLWRIGTSVRMPCGPAEHNCALQLLLRGVVVEP